MTRFRLRDVFDEIREIEDWHRQRDDASRVAASVTPGQRATINTVSRWAPWMTPGTVMALGRGGVNPRSPTVGTLARAEATRRASERPGGQPWGTPVQAGTMVPARGPQQTGRVDPVLAHEATKAERIDPVLRRAAKQERSRLAVVRHLESLGVLDDKGRLHRPLAPEFDEDEDAYRFDSDRDAKRWEAFTQTVRSVFSANDGQPVPFIDDTDGKRGEIYETVDDVPRAGNIPRVSDVMRRAEEIPGVGVMVWQADAAIKPVVDWVGKRRLPQPIFGSEALQATGPQDVGDVVRQLSMTADAPWQEFQGLSRTVTKGLRGEGWEFGTQSDLGIMATGGMSIQDAGGGFTVDEDSEVAQARRAREAEFGKIGDHNITWGRATANVIPGVDPDEASFNVLSGLVDFAVAVADPVALAAGKAARVRRARRVFAADDIAEETVEEVVEEAAEDAARGRIFTVDEAGTVTEHFDEAADEVVEAAGGIRGVHKAVDRPRAEAWLNGPVGTRVREELAAEPSPGRIWLGTNRKLPRNVAVRLADETSPEGVGETLKPLLGPLFREPGDVWATGEFDRFAKGMSRSQRLTSKMPGHRIDLDDPNDALVQMERWMRGAHFDDDEVITRLDRLARARDRNETFRTVMDVLGDTDGALARNGVEDAALRSELVRAFRDTHRDARHWFVDEMGHDVAVWTDVKVGGDVVEGFGPHLSIEHLDRFVDLPDMRPVRRLTSKYPTVFGRRALTTKRGELRLPLAGLSWIQEEIWKPFTLARLAWPVRVLGEEQGRMAAADFDSLIHHPISAIAIITGRKNVTDALGQPWDEAKKFQDAMAKHTAGWLNDRPGRVRTGVPSVFYKNQHELPDFMDGWTSELTKLHRAPEARHLAQTGSIDETAEWMTRGGGRGFYDELVSAHPELAEPGAVNRYLDTVQRRISVKTGDNTELLDAVRTGKLRGKRIVDDDGVVPTEEFRKMLGDFLDDAPDAVKGDLWVTAKGAPSRFRVGWDKTTDTAFGWLMTKPSNYLDRSSVFKQAYWQHRMPELIEFGDDAAKATILANARKAKVGSRTIRRLERTRAKGNLSADELDFYAKGHALDEVKELLYDMTERTQMWDQLKLVAPFGEAWQEVVTRWAKLGNPLSMRGLRNIRRGQQTFQGAKDAGIFWTNENDELVFTYPWSYFLPEQIMGVPIPMTGRVQGLSFLNEVMPGLGPVAQIPVAAALSDKPGWQRDLRNLLLPYGAPQGDGDWKALLNLETFAPPWMSRAGQALIEGGFDEESDRVYANAIKSAAVYLQSTGDYGHSKEEQQRLMEDARDVARGLYMYRGTFAFGAPSAPAPDYLVQDKNGNMVRYLAMRDDYYRMRDEDWETADERFLTKYGDDAFLVMQPFSYTTSLGVEPTQEFEDFVDANSELADLFPNTYGLFAPHDEGYDFEPGVYVAQFAAGERHELSPEQWRIAADDTLGDILYRRALEKVSDSPTDAERAWLRDVRRAIREDHPGWGDPGGKVERAGYDVLEAELRRASENPRVLETDAGKGLALFFEVHDLAMQEADGLGRASYFTSNDTRDLREWVDDVAATIIDEHPDFAMIYDRVFAHRIREDE